MVCYQNILRLEIPVVDSNGMAELNGVQELEKDMFGQSVVTHEAALFGDV
jgi:hypothetical protein